MDKLNVDKIAVLDFGGQYAHLIANRVRRMGVFSEIFDGDIKADQLKDFKGLILSGGPASVKAEDSLKCDPEIFNLGVPVLGICYGHQLIAHTLGGEVDKGKVSEYGSAMVSIKNHEGIFAGIGDEEKVWMSHFDQVTKVPEGFEIVGSTEDCPIAATMNQERNIFSVQFHPEVTHSPCGGQILSNFIELTGAKHEWSIDNYIEDVMGQIVEKVGDKKVFLMISGGVDSSVAFLLLAKALGQERVYGLFVDTGFMRMNEGEEVAKALKDVGVENLHVYDASEEFFDALKGVIDPEKKREIIGDLFLDIQAKVSSDLELNPEEWILGQGTIYPDTIETGGSKHADKIKTHHNQVDRVKKLIEEGKVIEPLDQLYKDEVRQVGEKLGLHEAMVMRHPFPGPGLAVRTLCSDGEDWPDNVEDLEKSVNETLENEGLSGKILPIKSVGVQGDERSYRHPISLLGAAENWSKLNQVSTRMTNQFREVNRAIWCLNFEEIESVEVGEKDLSRERIKILQEADKIVMDYLSEVGIHKEIWQSPTVLIPVGINGPGESIVLRPVCSQEAMTANFYEMDFDKLKELVSRLEKVEGVTGVFYDTTNKPPGTIEWE